MKVVENFTETVGFMASSLLSPGVLTPEVAEGLRSFATAKYESKEEKDKAFQALVESFPDRLAKELESLSAKSPSDVVEVKLDFGAFLYDLYVGGSTPPNAPLAQMAHQSRLQKLSERLDSKKMQMKPEELNVIKGVLGDDSRWNRMVFNAYVSDGEVSKRRVVSLNSTGITYFTKTIGEAVKLFEESNEKAETSDKQVDDSQEAQDSANSEASAG